MGADLALLPVSALVGYLGRRWPLLLAGPAVGGLVGGDQALLLGLGATAAIAAGVGLGRVAWPAPRILAESPCQPDPEIGIPRSITLSPGGLQRLAESPPLDVEGLRERVEGRRERRIG